jgi:deoxyribodipyrimidine photo-lyase
MAVRTLVWFRGKDLRVADHAPIATAARAGDVIPMFVLDPYFFAPPRAQRLAHRMQFLLASLVALQRKLKELGSRLVVVAGKSVEVVPRLAERWQVDRAIAQRWTEPFARERDRQIAAALRVPFTLLGGETLLPPETLRTAKGSPYTVFTPFARAFAKRAGDMEAPLPVPRRLPPLPVDIASTTQAPVPTLSDLGLAGNSELLEGGEIGARSRLRSFLSGPFEGYAEGRDRLDLAGTSRLSADLHFGTISARSVWSAVRKNDVEERAPRAARAFCNELIWREFAHSTLWDRPDLLINPFRAEFAGFPWLNRENDWCAWVQGTTGYPVVDAAARQLLGEGFVHNRARMIAASFLTKHLLIDFRWGEAHYLSYLVDGDWANNDMGWQWSAGCGCDAQPYFRIFNPTLQGERFDPAGAYVHRWVPELSRLPAPFVHRPWDAPADVLRRAGVVLDKSYPRPRADHAAARDRFLRVAEQHLRAGRRAAARRE